MPQYDVPDNSSMIVKTELAMIGELRKVLKRLHYPMEVMLCSRWYAVYPLSDRLLADMMQKRGVFVGQSIVYRRSLKILPVLAVFFRRRNRSAGTSSQMNETYIKVAGQWKCLTAQWRRHGDMVKQDHHAVKLITGSMLGFK